MARMLHDDEVNTLRAFLDAANDQVSQSQWDNIMHAMAHSDFGISEPENAIVAARQALEG